METIIQFVQTETNSGAEKLVTEKLANLSKHFSWILRANVFFKEEKGTYGKGKICEIILSCPGARLFASSDKESFEVSIAETIHDLELQLNKRKDEMQTH